MSNIDYDKLPVLQTFKFILAFKNPSYANTLTDALINKYLQKEWANLIKDHDQTSASFPHFNAQILHIVVLFYFHQKSF